MVPPSRTTAVHHADGTIVGPIVPPALALRIAAWRSPGRIGGGLLVVRRRGPGCARIELRTPGAADRTACRDRQAWVLRTFAGAGAGHVTLAEEACVAHGDGSCAYVVTWTPDHAGWVAPVAAGLPAAAVAGLALPGVDPRVAWALVPAAMAVAYAVHRWRLRRADPLARARAAAAFRRAVTAEQAASATGSDVAVEARPSPGGIVFEQRGNAWHVEYDGETALLRPSRGLALLAHLVRSPGQPIHVTELDAITPSGSAAARDDVALEPGTPPPPGDAGEVLDARARREYRDRLAELRALREEAEGRGDAAGAARVEAEIEAVTAELRAAVGPGGRVRRAGSDAERLRVAITQRIRSAIAQIAKVHPALGAHLTATVSTGYRCLYDPTAAERATAGRPQEA